ncbi:retrotransposable element ORF2 protein [Plecturocebus cupreus]
MFCKTTVDLMGPDEDRGSKVVCFWKNPLLLSESCGQSHSLWVPQAGRSGCSSGFRTVSYHHGIFKAFCSIGLSKSPESPGAQVLFKAIHVREDRSWARHTGDLQPCTPSFDRGTWMNLEAIILSKLTQEQKTKHYMFSLIGSWLRPYNKITMNKGWALWLTPVITTFWEAKVGRLLQSRNQEIPRRSSPTGHQCGCFGRRGCFAGAPARRFSAQNTLVCVPF